MQTLSSARRTCIAVASAVECTATVRMPISWQARCTRSAISPRLAISTFANMGGGILARPGLFDDQQRLAELDRHAALDQDARHGARARCLDLVEGLHRLDQQHRLPCGHLGADL